jgi:hypothetical protein
MPHQERSREMQECLDNCLNCHTVCLETIHHCLEMGGEHAEARHISLLHDCAEICMTSAHFLIGMSDFHPQTCGVCADICDACADSCEKLASGDAADFMQRCVDICRRCAESCRRMASGASSSASM